MEIKGNTDNQKIDKIILENMIRDFIAFAESLLNTEKITQAQYNELVNQKIEFLKGCKELE